MAIKCLFNRPAEQLFHLALDTLNLLLIISSRLDVSEPASDKVIVSLPDRTVCCHTVGVYRSHPSNRASFLCKSSHPVLRSEHHEVPLGSLAVPALHLAGR